MIIPQITFIIVVIYWIIAFSYLVYTPCVLASNKEIVKLEKKLSQIIIHISLTKGFKAEFFMTDTKQNIKELINENPELIDVLICNHTTTIDFLIVMVYLHYLGISNYNFLMNYKVKYWIGFGFLMYAKQDIQLFRDWDKDKDSLPKQIDNYKKNEKSQKQILLLFPEGTRFTQEKFKKAQEFSISKGIEKYDNLLVPKARGMWFLINSLKNSNKLGRVWDITLTIPSILGKSAYVNDLVGKPVGPIYCTIKELKLESNYQDLEIFKNWLFKNWKIKDEFIKYYKNFVYKKLYFKKYPKEVFIISLICIVFGLLLTKKYGRYYLLASLVTAYMLIIFK